MSKLTANPNSDLTGQLIGRIIYCALTMSVTDRANKLYNYSTPDVSLKVAPMFVRLMEKNVT
jgi:hypothetical protein